MKVKELIQKLKNCDENAIVVVDSCSEMERYVLGDEIEEKEGSLHTWNDKSNTKIVILYI